MNEAVIPTSIVVDAAYINSDKISYPISLVPNQWEALIGAQGSNMSFGEYGAIHCGKKENNANISIITAPMITEGVIHTKYFLCFIVYTKPLPRIN